MHSNRVAEFLNRAQKINDKSKLIESAQPLQKSFHTQSISPISVKKSAFSPISFQSFSSTLDGTPQPITEKNILLDTYNGKIINSISTKEKITKILSKSPTARENNNKLNISKGVKSKSPTQGIIQGQVRMKNKEEIQRKTYLAQNKIENQTQIKANDDQVEDIEKKCKKKIENMVEIIKQETLKMDHKLKELQEENKNLKEIMNSSRINPSTQFFENATPQVKEILEKNSSSVASVNYMKSISEFCESFGRNRKITEENNQISNWLDSLKISHKEFNSFITCISKKILNEQNARIKNNENTRRILEFNKNIIKELRLKVANSEGIEKNSSCRLIRDMSEKEVDSFDRTILLQKLELSIKNQY